MAQKPVSKFCFENGFGLAILDSFMIIRINIVKIMLQGY